MKAWVLGDPNELRLIDKPVPVPARRGAGAHRCGRHLRHRPRDHLSRPAGLIEGGAPHNKNFTPGHEYMGTVVALGPGVDEYAIGERVTVEIHAGCGQCKRCRRACTRRATTTA
jgi:L-iditol 2-dehydrogenase